LRQGASGLSRPSESRAWVITQEDGTGEALFADDIQLCWLSISSCGGRGPCKGLRELVEFHTLIVMMGPYTSRAARLRWGTRRADAGYVELFCSSSRSPKLLTPPRGTRGFLCLGTPLWLPDRIQRRPMFVLVVQFEVWAEKRHISPRLASHCSSYFTEVWLHSTGPPPLPHPPFLECIPADGTCPARLTTR